MSQSQSLLQESAKWSQQLVKNQSNLNKASNIHSENLKEVYFPYKSNQMNSQLIAMPDMLPKGGVLAEARTQKECNMIAAKQFVETHKINYDKDGFVEGEFQTMSAEDGTTEIRGTFLPLDGNRNTQIKVTGLKEYSVWVNEAMLTPFASNTQSTPFITWKHVPVPFLVKFKDVSVNPTIELSVSTKRGPPISITNPVYYNFNTNTKECTIFNQKNDISDIIDQGKYKDIILEKKPLAANTTSVGLNEVGQLMMYDKDGASTHLYGEPANAQKNNHKLTLNSKNGKLSLNHDTVIARGLNADGALTTELEIPVYRGFITSEQKTINGMRLPKQMITDKHGLVSDDNRLILIIENDALVIKKRIKNYNVFFSVQPDYKMGKSFLANTDANVKRLVGIPQGSTGAARIADGYKQLKSTTDFTLLNTTYRPGFNMNYLIPNYQNLDEKTQTEYGLKTPDLVGTTLMPITYEGFATQQEEVITNIRTNIEPVNSLAISRFYQINANVQDLNAGLQNYKQAKAEITGNDLIEGVTKDKYYDFSGNTLYALEKNRSKTAALLQDRETMLTEQNNLYIVSVISVAALFIGAIVVSGNP